MGESSRTRDQTRVPCIDRQIFIHCATRNAPLLPGVLPLKSNCGHAMCLTFILLEDKRALWSSGPSLWLPTQEATCWFTEICGCSVAQSGPTLCNLMDCVAYQAPLSMGFYKQDCWNGLSLPSPGDLSDPGTEPTSLTSPALAGGFFTTSATREALAEVRDACLCWQHFYKHRKSCCCNSRTLLWTEDISLRTLSDYALPFLLNSYLWGKQ